jgi:hypothetical protein
MKIVKINDFICSPIQSNKWSQMALDGKTVKHCLHNNNTQKKKEIKIHFS